VCRTRWVVVGVVRLRSSMECARTVRIGGWCGVREAGGVGSGWVLMGRAGGTGPSSQISKFWAGSGLEIHKKN
jgi:hypothetical protein